MGSLAAMSAARGRPVHLALPWLCSEPTISGSLTKPRDHDARLMHKIAPSSGSHLRVSPSHAWRRRNNARQRHRERLVERDFSRRARALFGVSDRRHRHERNADVGDRHHHADHRSRYRRGELLYLGGDALHDRLDRRRRLDRYGMVAPWRTARLYARCGRFRVGYGVLRAGPKHRLADWRARGAGVGRRPRFGKRHGADHRRIRLTPADPHYRDLARHLHRLPS